VVLIACAAIGCRSAPALDSCKDDLTGVWRVDLPAARATTPSGEPRRYHLLDYGSQVELYPMFDDAILTPGDRKVTTSDALIVAPTWLVLGRTDDGVMLIGAQNRNVARGPRACALHTPARIERCGGDRLELRWTPIAVPDDLDRCVPGPAAPETLVLHRERD